MAEWLRLADCEVLTIKWRGINYQVAHLVFEKSPYGTSRWFQSRPRFYMTPASALYLKGRDGRVVKARGLLSCVGSISRPYISSPKEVHIIRRVGFKHVRDFIWRQHLPIFLMEEKWSSR
jgi:hypothetical protein